MAVPCVNSVSEGMGLRLLGPISIGRLSGTYLNRFSNGEPFLGMDFDVMDGAL